MVERREQLRLALEAGETLRISCHLRRQHLDCDVAAEFRVGRPVHLAHPARSQRSQDLVGSQRAAGFECHLGSKDSLWRGGRHPGRPS